MKAFTTTGVCTPERNYMVDLGDRLRQIKAMVDLGQYFTINRARQYGKTTTLTALWKHLAPDYVVISISFQGISHEVFAFEGTFSQGLIRLIMDEQEFSGLRIPEKIETQFEEILRSDSKAIKLDEMFRILRRWCAEEEKPIVLMIDEVDSATNNQVFLDFLALLRDAYLARNAKGAPAFQSVILAAVTDVKNLKRKLRPEEEHKQNSPWNIASAFNVDMSLTKAGIEGMLADYETDHRTGMDLEMIAAQIHMYTGGYPFLVSRICQILDTEIVGDRFGTLADAWTIGGISGAVRRILLEQNTLFDSLMGKVYENQEMSDVLERILFAGDVVSYNPDLLTIADAQMYGLVKNDHGNLAVANTIFETRLYNYYLGRQGMQESPLYREAANHKSSFIRGNQLLMKQVLARFITVFDDLYGDQEQRFDEAEGRRRFLLFIRPIINGTGNYYIEAETRNDERMDLVIDYLGERFVIELKIWNGKVYHEKGEKQLADYLSHYHLTKGYMLTFSFNKGKKPGMATAMVNGKELVEAFVLGRGIFV